MEDMVLGSLKSNNIYTKTVNCIDKRHRYDLPMPLQIKNEMVSAKTISHYD